MSVFNNTNHDGRARGFDSPSWCNTNNLDRGVRLQRTITMNITIDLVGKITGFTKITHDDIGCEFLTHGGEVVTITRKDGEFFDGSDNYGYDCNGIAWTRNGICSILVERIGTS